MKKTLYVGAVLVLVGLLAACSSQSPHSQQIADFSFTNQDGQPFGTDELAGKVWIADFIFTKCDTVCPPMTVEMANLQKTIKEQDIDVEFVSFTVDPQIDSPNVLKQYIQQFSDDESNWNLLTGYSQEDINTFAREQFQTIVQKPASSNQVLHGTNFYLIDRDGRIVKEYNYIEPAYVDDMIRDIKRMSKS